MEKNQMTKKGNTTTDILTDYLKTKIDNWQFDYSVFGEGTTFPTISSHEIEQKIPSHGKEFFGKMHNGSTYARAWRKLKENGHILDIGVHHISVAKDKSTENTWKLHLE